MAETIGSRLCAAREAKGMSLDDIAFATRIPAKYVRSLERDDYSGFASTTYAKSFLSLYARHLGVDAGEALRYFDGVGEIRLAGRGYLSALGTLDSGPAPAVPARRAPQEVTVNRSSAPGFAPVVLGLLVALLLAGIPLLWFLGKDAASIDELASRARALAEGQDAAAPAAGEPAAEEAVLPPRERGAAADWVVEQSDPGAADTAEAAPATEPAPAAEAVASVSPAPAAEPPRARPAPPADPEPQPEAPVAAPLRAVPLIAVPVDLSAPPEEDGAADEDEADGEVAQDPSAGNG